MKDLKNPHTYTPEKVSNIVEDILCVCGLPKESGLHIRSKEKTPHVGIGHWCKDCGKYPNNPKCSCGKRTGYYWHCDNKNRLFALCGWCQRKRVK